MAETNSYTEIELKVPSAARERAEAVATMVSPAGFSTEDYAEFDEMYSDLPGELVAQQIKDKPKDQSVIRLYVSQEDNAAAVAERLAALCANAGIEYELALRAVDESDWADNWKQYFHPFHIGDIVVSPSWELYAGRPEDKILKIDPGMAFGTGQHETTRLCIELLQQYLNSGDRVLDMGSGSGILSIAALLLGAREALGVDIDAYALKRARENAALNGFGLDVFKTLAGDAAADESVRGEIGGGYNIVMANIVADVLIAQREIYFDALREGGVLLASGVINTRADEVARALTQAGFLLLEQRTRNDWVAFAMQKPGQQTIENRTK